MKKVFIPAGQTVSYNTLNTDSVIVHGILCVSGKLIAKEIIGRGNVEADEIICDNLCVSCATANDMTARKIIAEKLFVQRECRASVQIAVRDYFSAEYVSTGTLTVSLSEIGSCDVDNVIVVRQRGNLLGLLWASWWRGLYLNLFHRGKAKNHEVEESATSEPILAEMPIPATEGCMDESPNDDTINLMITVLTNLKDRGYRVVRETPANERNRFAA